jgi:hypothetical protein
VNAAQERAAIVRHLRWLADQKHAAGIRTGSDAAYEQALRDAADGIERSEHAAPVTCDDCDGTGGTACPGCEGQGSVLGETCIACRGAGRIACDCGAGERFGKDGVT